jgi:poly(ADP-ribose) glycohydrolase
VVIGFDQSDTQEETHVGISPEACPAVLVTPPLKDNQILIIRGAEVMVNMVGQRRDIRICALEVCKDTLLVPATNWTERTTLLIDALELDMVSGDEMLPDLEPGNVRWKLVKAYLAFSSALYEKVITPLWGCGAFGGDPGVKMLVLWCSASLSSTSLRITCDKQLHDVREQLESTIALVWERCTSAEDLFGLINQIPKQSKRFQTLSRVMEYIKNH